MIQDTVKSNDANLSFEDLKLNIESPRGTEVKTVLGEVLGPKYSFENYVVGKSNQFAHASALAVATKPGVYNPLFISGKTGLGKTHLLKAIGYRLAQHSPGVKICYSSTQRFIEDVIQSIQHNQRHELRELYKNQCDILLLDDIQFLSRANSTQDEFFHIFNSLYDAGKQIVVASDRLPKEIQDVHERVISRFEWGMVSEIDVPELETRVAILRSRAQSEKIRLADDVAYLIASYVKSNVRELEGSLIKIAAHAAMYTQEITVELVRKVLKNYIAEKQKIVSIEDLIALVSQFYGLKSSDLRGQSRKGPVAKARQIVMFLAREVAQMSASAIGQELGSRHHTTILHGHSFIKESIEKDPVLKNQIRQIENSLKDKP